MKIDRFYDIQCSDCGRWRSTDYQKGMEQDKERIAKLSSLEGWGYKNRKGNLCPVCNHKMTLADFCRQYS